MKSNFPSCKTDPDQLQGVVFLISEETDPDQLQGVVFLISEAVVHLSLVSYYDDTLCGPIFSQEWGII